MAASSASATASAAAAAGMALATAVASPGRSFWQLVIRATDKDYPVIIHLPHSIISVARYRRWRQQEGVSRAWFYDLLLSFYTHSQGGGCFSKNLLEGKSVMAYMNRWDLTHFHVLAYLLAYWSPWDAVYRAMNMPRHPARLLCVAADEFDAVTATCGLVDLALELHPKNKFLPALVGVVLYSSGAAVRWLDERARGKATEPIFLTAPRGAAARGVVLALAYRYFGRRHPTGSSAGSASRDLALVAVSGFAVLLGVLEDAMEFDFFEGFVRRLSIHIKPRLRWLRDTLHLGPPVSSSKY